MVAAAHAAGLAAQYAMAIARDRAKADRSRWRRGYCALYGCSAGVFAANPIACKQSRLLRVFTEFLRLVRVPCMRSKGG